LTSAFKAYLGKPICGALAADTGLLLFSLSFQLEWFNRSVKY